VAIPADSAPTTGTELDLPTGLPRSPLEIDCDIPAVIAVTDAELELVEAFLGDLVADMLRLKAQQAAE
jgi:hypothetical protein